MSAPDGSDSAVRNGAGGGDVCSLNVREKRRVDDDDCYEDGEAAGGTDAIEFTKDGDRRRRRCDSDDVEQEHIRRENHPPSGERLAQPGGGGHEVSGHRDERPDIEQLDERNTVSKADGSSSHNRPSHILRHRNQGGYDHSGANKNNDRDGEDRRRRGGGVGLAEISRDERDCGDRRRTDSNDADERDSGADSGEGGGGRSGDRNGDSRRSEKGGQRGDDFRRERRSDDHRERDSLDERGNRSLDRREDAGGDFSSTGDKKREGRDDFGRETRSAAGDAGTGRGPVESRSSRPVNSYDRGRDDSRERRRYGRDRIIADSGRGFAGGGSRKWNWPKDRADDSTRDRTRDGPGDRFRNGDRRDVGNDPRDLPNGDGGGGRLHGDRSGDSRQRGDYSGERRSNDRRRRESRDRNGYRNDRGRGAESWTSGGDRESRGRNDGNNNRRDWKRDGRNGPGSRDIWSTSDSRERRSPPAYRESQAREPNALFRTRDDSRAPSPCATIGIRDGQWVGGGVHVRSTGASGRNDIGREDNRANRAGAPSHAAGAQSTPMMMGFVAAGNESAGSTRPAAATAPAAAAAITAKIAAAGGDMPRRPRWDKAGPGSSAAACSGTVPGKAGEPTGKKKLVWGSGSAATGGGGDGVAGKKRALWATGAGGEAGRTASTEAQGAAAAVVGDVPANQQEHRWQQAAAALGPADRQIKFLRLLGAKGAAAATEAGSAPAGIPSGSGPIAVQDCGNPDAAASAHKVMQDLEIQYRKAQRAHFGFQRGLGK